MTQRGVSRLQRLRAAGKRRWLRLKNEHPWVRHTVAALERFNAHNGSQYAAAITYFSFLALFPLLLLTVSIAGFFLTAHPAALESLLRQITTALPGSVGESIRSSLANIMRQRAGLGAVGFLGVVLVGLGWVGNLRSAIAGVWGTPLPKRNFLLSKVSNLLLLAGLGFGLFISMGLTIAGTSLTAQVLRSFGLNQSHQLHYLLTGVGLVLGFLGDLLIFGWLLVRLPGTKPSRSAAITGTVLAAIGFEVLKVVGTYTIAASARSLTAGPFAGLLAVLIWIQLVVRFLLFCVALMAELSTTPDPNAAKKISEPPTIGA